MENFYREYLLSILDGTEAYASSEDEQAALELAGEEDEEEQAKE